MTQISRHGSRVISASRCQHSAAACASAPGHRLAHTAGSAGGSSGSVEAMPTASTTERTPDADGNAAVTDDGDAAPDGDDAPSAPSVVRPDGDIAPDGDVGIAIPFDIAADEPAEATIDRANALIAGTER